MTQPTLKIVDLNLNDYNMGNILLSQETVEFSEQEKISAALSLFFQWPEYAESIVYPDFQDSHYLTCSIDYDRNLSEVDCLFISFKTASPRSYVKGDNLRLRFEVFRTCYEFRCEVLAQDPNSTDQDIRLACSIPKFVKLYKHRRLPRHKIDKETQASLPKVMIDQTELILTEISMLSFTFESKEPINEGLTTVTMGDANFCAEIKLRDNECIAAMQFNDDLEAGLYFDFYRLVAYKDLVPFTAADPNKVFELYLKSGFIESFRSDATRSNWTEDRSALNKFFHTFTADYVEDLAGDYVGASSVMKAYMTSDGDQWTFHQLCSLKDPKTLQSTGMLYKWRSEYLANKVGEFEVLGKYRSDSRWLDRIYTKYAMVSPNTVLQANVTTQKLRCPDIVEAQRDKNITVAKAFGRTFFYTQKLYGGINPKYSNLAGILDSVFLFEGALDRKLLSSICASVPEFLSRNIVFTMASDVRNEIQTGIPPGKTDRLVVFKQKSLPDLIYSIDHIIALTVRRLG